MPVTLELPQATRKQRKRTPGTWTPEQAQAARAKSLETRQRKAQERRLAKLNPVPEPEPVSVPDPYTHVAKALERAAKRNCGQLAANLALALTRIPKAEQAKTKPKPSASYTPTGCISPASTYAKTPQVSQPVQYQPSTVQPDFAQYAQPLKESITARPVGAGYPGQGSPGSGVGGVIESNTRRSFLEEQGKPPVKPVYSTVQEEIAALEQRLAVLKAQVNQGKAVQVQGSVGVVPVKPAQEMERFCVNGHWILGKRVK